MGHPWEIFLRLLPISWSWLFANSKALGLSRHGAVVVVPVAGDGILLAAHQADVEFFQPLPQPFQSLDEFG